MYVIYEKNSAQLSFFEDEGEDIVDLNEAEELLRLLRKDDPREFERISELRDGIRAAKVSTDKGLYVFCQAGRYQQLFLVDEKGEVVSRDIPRVLGVIKAGPEEKSLALPPGFNAAVMRVKRVFAEEARHREAEREHTLSLSHGQRYVLRELRVLFGVTSDEDGKAQINILEKAFRSPVTDAVKRELNRIRRNGIAGPPVLKALGELYLQHRIARLDGPPGSSPRRPGDPEGSLQRRAAVIRRLRVSSSCRLRRQHHQYTCETSVNQNIA